MNQHERETLEGRASVNAFEGPALRGRVFVGILERLALRGRAFTFLEETLNAGLLWASWKSQSLEAEPSCTSRKIQLAEAHEKSS